MNLITRFAQAAGGLLIAWGLTLIAPTALANPPTPKVVERVIARSGSTEEQEDIAQLSSLREQVLQLHAQGQHRKAVEVSAKLLEKTKLVKGEHDASFVDAARTHANMLFALGDTRGGLDLLEGILHAGEKTYLDELTRARLLQDIGDLLSHLGNHAAAEVKLQEALSIFEARLGRDSDEAFIVQQAIGNTAWRAGKLGRAEIVLSSALDRLTRRHSDSELIPLLNNLAITYEELGDYERAEHVFRRALEGMGWKAGETRPEHIVTVIGFAAILRKRGNLTESEVLYRSTLQFAEQQLGEDHRYVGDLLSGLSTVLAEKENVKEAESLARRSLRIRENTFGKESLYTSTSRFFLGRILHARGNYAEAETLLNATLNVREQMLGSHHPRTAEAFFEIAALHLTTKEPQKALEFLTRAASIDDAAATAILAAGSEKQKRAFMAVLRSRTDLILSLDLTYGHESVAMRKLAMSTVLRRKGRVLDAMVDISSVLRSRINEEELVVLQRLMDVQSEMAAMFIRGPGSLPMVQFEEKLAGLENMRQSLEAKLSESSAAVVKANQEITVESVAASIPANAALVELVEYQPYKTGNVERIGDRWQEPHYAAYVLRRNAVPISVDLGPTGPIDQAVSELRKMLGDPTSNPKPAARILDSIVMGPLRKVLGGVATLLMSPDGALNLVPFGALVDENGQYLLDHYAFRYLSSGRDLMRVSTRMPRSGIVIIANPDFGGSNIPINSNAGSARERGVRSVDFGTIEFPSLPETAMEAQAIAERLAHVTVLLGAKATESALKSIHGPALLHIATHGFFLPRDPTAAAERQARSDDVRQGNAVHRENLLLRSGLALAGANLRASGTEDGVLTALEAGMLDLDGTNMVVLSACETGLGESISGEGVYGLRRGFAIAGADSLLMSLWRVDDAATRDLMAGYYDTLARGGTRIESLRQVALSLRHNQDTAHPYYWAGFILSGEGGPLLQGGKSDDFIRVAPSSRGCACRVVSPVEPASKGEGFLFSCIVASIFGARQRRKSS